MNSTSHWSIKERPSSPPAGTIHAPAWENLKKLVQKVVQNDVFWWFSRIFSGSPRGLPREDLKIFEGFSMSWSSRDHPWMIPDGSWKLHFFMKISQKMTLKIRWSYFVHPSKINRNPDLRVDSESFVDFLWLFLISLNSTDRILRNSQNKIEKGTFGNVED